MGYGSYTAADWNRLKNSRGLGPNSNVASTFKATGFNDKYNAKFIGKRESFDSDDSPMSTPIILGFDVTGSMGYLANEIATNSLNETITKILERKPVTDPHMMCAAFIDPNSPLQVTQFEADIRVVEQLLDFTIRGGNRYSYDTILWYFAAKHTVIDSYNKRQQKGILIGIGDEICGGDDNILTAENIKNLFDDDVNNNYKYSDILRLVQEKYEIIHIVIGNEYRMNTYPNRPDCSYDTWTKNLPKRTIGVYDKDIKYLSDVIVAAIQVITGTPKRKVISSLPLHKRALISEALADFDK